MRGNRGDGGIWRLSWEKTPDGYRAWVRDNPSVEATGAVWEDVNRELYDRVLDELQGGEWTADWDPPPPTDDGPTSHVLAGYVNLSGEGRFAILDDLATLFEGGICGECGHPIGRRTTRPIHAHLPESQNMLFSAWTSPFIRHAVSADFLGTLIDEQRVGFEFRPIERVGPGRKAFFEIIHPYPIPYVHIKGFPIDCEGCSVCGHKFYFYCGPAFRLHYFINASTAPTERATFAAGTCHQFDFFVRQDWWRSIAGSDPCRGITSSAIGVVPDNLVDPASPIRPLSKPGSKGRNWPKHWLRVQTQYADRYGLQLPR